MPMRALLRSSLALAAINLLWLGVALYGVNQAGPIITAEVGDDGCDFLDSNGHAVRYGSDAAVRPDPLDPDCVSGGLGGTPWVTAEEAAAARNLWPSPGYVLLSLAGALLFVLIVMDPDGIWRLGNRLRKPRRPLTG